MCGICGKRDSTQMKQSLILNFSKKISNIIVDEKKLELLDILNGKYVYTTFMEGNLNETVLFCILKFIV